MITLYWCPMTRSARAFWMLEEVAQPYRLELVDIRRDPRADPPGYRDIHPLGKVPAIADGDAKVADSAAIALYLADRYAPGDLAPRADDPDRGEFLTWLFYSPSAIEPAMSERASGSSPVPTSNAWGSWDAMLAALERRLDGRDWIAGDRFTMADLMVGGSIDFMASFGMLDPSPRLQAYRERCVARPQHARAAEKEQAATADADFTAP